MKNLFEFTNGEIRFDNNRNDDATKLLLWGLIGVDYIKREATEAELKNEKKRLRSIDADYKNNTLIIDEFYTCHNTGLKMTMDGDPIHDEE